MNLDHKLLNGAGSHRPRPKIPTFSERTTERETETLKETYITLQEYTYRYLSTHINVSFCVISVSLLLIKFPPFHDFVSSSDLSLSLYVKWKLGMYSINLRRRSLQTTTMKKKKSLSLRFKNRSKNFLREVAKI